MPYPWQQPYGSPTAPVRKMPINLPFSQSPGAFDVAIQSGYVKPPTGYVSPYTPSNDPQQAVWNYRARLGAAGVEYPTEPKKTALFWRIIDLLEHPRYAVVGFVKGLLEPSQTGQSEGLASRLTKALQYAWSGLTGTEEHSVTDILKSYGVTNKIALALGGFAGNLLLDPLTYISPFKGLNKAGVTASQAPDLASDLAKLGKEVPEIITKDIIRDVQAEAWKYGAEAVAEAVKTGKELSSISAKLNKALGIQDASSDIAKRIVSALEDVYWTRTKINIKPQMALASKLGVSSTPVQNLTAKQIAYANALADEFGSAIKGVDIISGAKKLASTSAGRSWIKRFGAIEKAATEAAEKVTRVTLANGLAANFAEETGRTWLTFMGKPLLETTIVKKGIGKTAGEVYKRMPESLKRTADTLRRMFSTSGWSYRKDLSEMLVPGAAHAQKALETTVLPSVTREALEGLARQTMKQSRPLEVVKSFIQDTARLGRGLPTTSALAVYDLLGPEIFGNAKLSEALLYYSDYLDVLGRNVDDGGAALRNWNRIKPTLTQDEMGLIMNAHRNIGIMMEQIDLLDKIYLGSQYVAQKDYLPRAYNFIKGVDGAEIATRAQSILAKGTAQKQIQAILSTKNYHELARVIPSISWALENADLMKQMGLEVITDIRVPLASRITDTWGKVYNALLDDAIQDLVPTGLASLTEKKGWLSIINPLKENQRIWIDPEVGAMLTAMRNQFTNDIGLAQAIDFFSQVTQGIKTLQITLNPTFHIRNMMGEAAMNLFAGVSVDAHIKAFNALQSVLDNGPVEIAGRIYTAKDLVRMFASTGLGFEGIGADGMVRTIESAVRNIAGQGKRNLSPVELGRAMSDFTDTYFRMAHFIEGLERGMTPQGAAEWVRKFHVDYSDITMFEKSVMRTLFPYYTFTRKNIPMQIRMMLDNPGIFTGIANLVESANRALGDPTTSKFLESNLAIPVYDDGEHIMYLNWNLPISDLGRIQTSWEDTIREFASMLHPLFRIPLEIGINRSLATWQPIVRTGEEWVPSFGPGSPKIPAQLRYVWSQLGAPWAIRQAIAGPEEHETPGLTQPRQIPLLSSLLPVKNKLQMQTARAYEMRELLNEITQRAQARGIYVPSIDELRRRRGRGYPWRR